jgi:serine/threonine protein kinase
MPPENVPDSSSSPQFTRKGDVWAYGVVLFEIWSKGRLPYEDQDDNEVILIMIWAYKIIVVLYLLLLT